jgi:YVTN family beta-propeller protein
MNNERQRRWRGGQRGQMSNPIAAILGAVCAMAIALTAVAAETNPLQLEAKIPLGDVAGRSDHMAYDIARNRLFVAELGNNSVGVIDINGRKVLRRISGLKEPQGVAYLASRDLLYVANGGDGVVRIYRGSDFSPAAMIPLGSDADNIRLDLAANRLIVGYGKGALAIIDPTGGAKVADIPLKAHPESFQLDPGSDRIFVNLPETRSIAVVNKAPGRELANWQQAHGGNFAMALDNEKQRVFVVFRDPAKFVALAKDTGAVVAETDVCGDVDDLFLDAKRQRVYISCGQGFIDVLDARDAAFPRLARIPTVTGARTSLFVADADRLFLAVRAQAGQAPAIWVYRTVD